MREQHGRSGAWQRGERGQMLVIFALAMTVFTGALMLGVDLSHVRQEAENAQNAANAAALAGVVFMPNYQSQAFYRAQEEATKNGFTTDATKGITVTPAAVPGYSYRLKVTITEPVSLFFGHLFGLGNVRITRSATAEFLPPLQMGSPDYVLGYSPFPTTLVPTPAPENFYLNQNGAYDYKENGDPYSTFYESYNGPTFNADSVVDNNPCPPPNGPAACSGATVNALHSASNGYDYNIVDPLTNTLLVKLFDPFSEFNYDQNARSFDSGPCGNPNSCYAPTDRRPVDTSGHCVLGTEGGPCRNEMIDMSRSTCDSYGSCRSHGTSLEFSLYGPAQSLLDPALQSSVVTQTPPITNTKCNSPAINCVITSPYWNAGEDPTPCNSHACQTSLLAFRFVNYAIIQGPGVFRLNVRSVAGPDGAYGTSSNAYGIAVCNALSDTTYTSPPALGPLGNTSAYTTYVTSDPMVDSSGHSVGWNTASCYSPNTASGAPAACATPRTAPPGTCVQVYAAGKMPLFNYVAAGSSLIPLGYIPADYAGKTINVDLYDPGDIDAGSTSFGCLTPPGSPSPVNSMEILTPAGDLTCGHVDGGNVTGPVDGTPYPSSLNYSWTAAPDLPASGYYTNSTLQTPTANTPLDVGSGSNARIFNGTWVHLHIPIPANYASIVNNFGGYWKVLYRIGGDGHDVTTWSLTVSGTAVHLVSR